ncbi:MAG: ribonuclease R [Gammaproteobacteria bacterium]
MTKHPAYDDPYAAREAAKYPRPIPSREYLLSFMKAQGIPLRFEQLVAALSLTDPQDQEGLRRRLRAMERDGQIIRNRRDGYGLLEKMDLACGRVVAHREGYGRVVPDDGGESLLLSPWEMRAVLHGDRVVARVTGVDRRGRKQGAIVDILERNTREVVGRFFIERGIGFVVPNSKDLHQDILVPPDHTAGAQDGQIVVTEILDQPTKHAQPIGRIVEVLGEHLAPGMEIDLAVRAYQLPAEWPPDVRAECERFTTEVSACALEGRVDLRDLPLVTIDGADARDFDDAVYCHKTARGWRLLVAIADVSAYVGSATALDGEAYRRGNSVYFPGRVIPMLPEVLSNELCSLKPEVDRLCLACEMSISQDGRITRSRFLEGVMRSRRRLTYDEVAEALVARHRPERRRLADVIALLDELYALYRVLRGARDRRGAIDIDGAEPRIVFGPQRKIERFEVLQRNDAHRIIEECMIAANVAAARLLRRHKMPVLYRTHGGPTAEKLTDVHAFLRELGLKLGGGAKPSAQDYAALLHRTRARADKHLVQTVLLRSLPQARYSPDNIGHFGLALECYTHYTSPIRRYPDLLVHRAIRHLIRGAQPGDYELRHGDLQGFGEHCSMTERRADEATRDAIDRLKCEFMLDKVGDIFQGLITAVTSFGLFVMLDSIYAEGLVHISVLGNDYYHYDPIHHRLRGERTGLDYRLADPIVVRVVRVDVDERKIDFELAEGVKVPSGRGPRRRGRLGRRSKLRSRK